MKKFSFLLLAMLVMSLNFVAKADCTAISTFPWVEKFDSYTANDTLGIECWVNAKLTDGSKKLYYINGGLNNSTGLRYNSYSIREDNKSLLVLPPMKIDADNTYEFTFDINRTTTSKTPLEGVRVCVSTSPIDAQSDLSTCDTLGIVSRYTGYEGVAGEEGKVVPKVDAAGWYRYSFTLPQGDAVYIVLIYESRWGQNTDVDNFRVRAIPTCSKVETEIALTNTTAHGVTLHFDDEPGDYECLFTTQNVNPLILDLLTDEDIDAGAQGIAAAVGFNSDDGAVAKAISDNAIAANTTYYLYLRRVCGEKKSDWVSAGSIKTLCDDVVSIDAANPYENLFNSSNDIECWNFISPNSSYPQVSSGTLLMAPTVVGSYITDPVYAILPKFSKDLNKLTLSFICRQGGSEISYEDSLYIGVMTDITDPTTFTPLHGIRPSYYRNTSQYDHVEFSFSQYAGTGQFIAIKRVCLDYPYSLGSRIDSVKVEYTPCPKLYDIHLDNIGSDSVKVYGTETSFNTLQAIIAKTPLDVNAMTEEKLYTSEDNENIVGAVELNPEAVEEGKWSTVFKNLNSGTRYYVYARQSCGDADWSAWSKVRTFRTRYAVPFYHSFANLEDWEQYQFDIASRLAGTDIDEREIRSWWSIKTNEVFGQAHARVNACESSNNVWLVSPSIDMTIDDGKMAYITLDVAYTGSEEGGNIPDTTADNPQRLLMLISDDDGETWTKANTFSFACTDFDKENDPYVEDEDKFFSLKHIAVMGNTGAKISYGTMYFNKRTIRLALGIVAPGNKSYYFHVKDLSIKAVDAYCPLISSIEVTPQATTATVTLHALGIEDAEIPTPELGVKYQYGTDADNLSEATSVENNPFTLSNLQPNTEYLLRAYTACGVDNYAEVRFTTNCLTQIPYAQNFDDAEFWNKDKTQLSSCWTVSRANQQSSSTDKNGNIYGTTNYSGRTDYGLMIDHWRNIKSNGSNKFVAYNIGHGDSVALKVVSTKTQPQYLVLPEMDQDIKDLTVSFSMRACARLRQYMTYAPFVANYQTPDYARSITVGTVDDPNDISTFKPIRICTLQEIPCLSADSLVAEWMWDRFSVDLATAEGKNLAFMSNYDLDNIVWIDDIAITTGSVASPDEIKVAELGETTVKITSTTPDQLNGDYRAYIYNLTNSTRTTKDLTANDGMLELTLDGGTNYKVEIAALDGTEESDGRASVFFRTLQSHDGGGRFDFETNLYNHYQAATTSTRRNFEMADGWRAGWDNWSSNTNIVCDTMNTSSSTYARSGSKALFIGQDKSKEGSVWVAMPKFNFEDASQTMGQMQVSFYVRAGYYYNDYNGQSGLSFRNYTSSDYAHNVKVGLVKHPDSISTVYEVLNYQTRTIGSSDQDPVNLFWEKVTVDLVDGHGDYVVFYCDSENINNYIYIDDVQFRKQPDCADPTDISITTTASTATVTWNIATESNVRLVLLDANQTDTIEEVTTAEKTYTFMDLLPATKYFVSLQTDCEDTEYEPYFETFTTIHGLNYSEDFASMKSYVLPDNWTIRKGNADSIIAGKQTFTAEGITDWKEFLNGYNNNFGMVHTMRMDSKDSLWLVSPVIDLTTQETNSIYLTFNRAIATYSSASYANLTAPTFPDDTTMDGNMFCVLICDEESQEWKVLHWWDGKRETDTEHSIRAMTTDITGDTFDISAYRNKPVRFAFYQYNRGTMGSDLYHILLGNIKLYAENANCGKVSDITVSDISFSGTKIQWTNPDESNSRVETVITSDEVNPEYSQTVIVRDTVENVSEYIIDEDLAKHTTYYLWIRNICSDDNFSTWSEATPFTTPYGIPFTPFKDVVYAAGTMFDGWTRTGDLSYADNTITNTLITNQTYGTWSMQNVDNNITSVHAGIMCNSASKRWLTSPIIDMTDVAADTTLMLHFDLTHIISGTVDTAKWLATPDSLVLMVKAEDEEFWSMQNAVVWANNTNADHRYSRLEINHPYTYFVDMSQYAGKKVQLGFYTVSTGAVRHGLRLSDLAIEYSHKSSSVFEGMPILCRDDISDLAFIALAFQYDADSLVVMDGINDRYVFTGEINEQAITNGQQTLLIYVPASGDKAMLLDTFRVNVVENPVVLIKDIVFDGEKYSNADYGIDIEIKNDGNDSMYVDIPQSATTPCEGYILFTNVRKVDSIIVDTTITVSQLPYSYTYNAETKIEYSSATAGDIFEDTIWISIDRVNGLATRLFHKLTITEDEAPKPMRNFKLITEEPTSWEGEYILGVTDPNDPTKVWAWNGKDEVSNYSEFEPVNDVITTNSAMTITVAAMEGGYSMCVNGGENDGKYCRDKNGENGFNFEMMPSLVTFAYKTATEGEDTIDILSNNMYVLFNSNEGNLRFGFFKPANYTNAQYLHPHLYKLVEDTPQEPTTYTVVGSNAVLFGTAWDQTLTNNDMTENPEGTWKWTKSEVTLAASEIEYKVVANHDWNDPQQFPADGNQTVTIEEAGVYTVTITYIPAAEGEKLTIDATKTGEAETIYYMKHGWGDGQDASWSWKALTQDSTNENLWTISDIYGGTGCNYNTVADDGGAQWVESPTLMGEPAVGDSAIFTLDISTQTITITKIGTETGLVNRYSESDEPVKVLRDGQVYIRRRGEWISVLGNKVRR